MADAVIKKKKDVINAYDYAQDASAKIKIGVDENQLLKKSFPSNSYSKHIEKKEDKKVNKVVKTKVIKKKKSLAKKFIETFVGDDVDSVSSYIINDILIASAKDVVADIVRYGADAIKGSVETVLFGEVRTRGNSRRDSGRGYVSYDRYSSNRKESRRDNEPIRNVGRSRYSFDELIIGSASEANEVLSNLVDLTIDYGQASVANLYDLLGITESFTDYKYGWEDLSSAKVRRVREGWILVLPKVIVLD